MPRAVEPDEQAYLTKLGAGVRHRRETEGLTRKFLAQKAGVSERYLAQLELGSGNASMLLLRKLAIALDCSLNQLIDPHASNPAANRPIVKELANRLPELADAQLVELADLIRSRFGSAEGSRRTRVALVGLRGAGKSTVGKLLASALGSSFIELDHEIEREMGSDLAGIFSVYGQDAYREAEVRVLDRLLEGDESFVVATGGSIVDAPTAYATVRTFCFTVWLQAEPGDHMSRVIEQGDMRPMRGRAHAMTELQNILSSRRELYQLADQSINTSALDLSQCVAQIVASLGNQTAVQAPSQQ